MSLDLEVRTHFTEFGRAFAPGDRITDETEKETILASERAQFVVRVAGGQAPPDAPPAPASSAVKES